MAAQNLSPDEISRMNHEQDTLRRQLKDLRDKITEASQASSEHELLVSRSMDRFNACLSEYGDLGHRIGTIQGAWDGPVQGPGGIDYSIDLDLATDEMHDVQACARRMRETLRPALNKYDEEIRGQTRTLGQEQAQLDSEYDKLALVVDKQKGDVGNKELELAKRLQEADTAQAVSCERLSLVQLSDSANQYASRTSRNIRDCKNRSRSSKTRYRTCRRRRKWA